jgi:hypothetical protein
VFGAVCDVRQTIPNHIRRQTIFYYAKDTLVYDALCYSKKLIIL